MNTLITVIVTVLMLGILVIVHEGGHYLAARAFKVGIMEFSVGMGPVLFKKKGKALIICHDKSCGYKRAAENGEGEE